MGGFSRISPAANFIFLEEVTRGLCPAGFGQVAAFCFLGVGGSGGLGGAVRL